PVRSWWGESSRTTRRPAWNCRTGRRFRVWSGRSSVSTKNSHMPGGRGDALGLACRRELPGVPGTPPASPAGQPGVGYTESMDFIPPVLGDIRGEGGCAHLDYVGEAFIKY